MSRVLKISRLIKECFFPHIYQQSRALPDQLSPFLISQKITKKKKNISLLLITPLNLSKISSISKLFEDFETGKSGIKN